MLIVSETKALWKELGLFIFISLKTGFLDSHTTIWDVSASSKLMQLIHILYRNSDFTSALEYLKKALVYESKQEEKDQNSGESVGCNTAGTILNICAILSKLNK